MARSRHSRSGNALPVVLLGMLLPCLLIGLFVWLVFRHAEHDSKTALAEGRVVLISLPSGTVQGGVTTKTLPAAEQTPPAAAPVMDQATPVALIPPPGKGLKEAPYDKITTMTPDGPLPIVGEDGTKPWTYYARPAPEKPTGSQIAVVVMGLGLSSKAAETALKMPAAVTLSFSPYASDAAIWAGSARALGHEVMVDLPLEPDGYPAIDPGPQALFTHLATENNIKRADWVLSRYAGHIGTVTGFSERFTANADAAGPVLKHLNSRGLLLVMTAESLPDATQTSLKAAGIPYLGADIGLGDEATPEDIERGLTAAESAARKNGQALVVVAPAPGNLKAVAEWLENLEKKGILLTPVSALARSKFS